MASFTDGMAAIFRDTMGEPVTYTKVGGAPIAIVGIPEMPAITVDGLSEVQIVDADSWLHFAEADLPVGYGEGDTMVVRGVTYRAKAPMPDGRGMVRIPLSKA